MGNEVNFVRFRNDGDDFHVLWTARRALGLLNPTSGLVGVAVEGVYERELDGGELSAGLLVVDTAEYYGSRDIRQATLVAYYQVKYSTQEPEMPWPVSGLADTLKGFADRFRQAVIDLGKPAVLGKIRFRFVTNRPISGNVVAGFDALAQGTAPETLGKAVQNARQALIEATGLSDEEFRDFAGLVEFWADQHDRQELANVLGQDARRVSLDSEATLRMKELVRSRTTSDTARDKLIDRDRLLLAFHATHDELFPAPAKLEARDFALPRAQEADIASAIVATDWPLVIQAAGGVGKTVLAQRLAEHMPAGSETVLFDGFAAGDYRNTRTYRHKAARGVVQIVNELAARGLCDILIPQNGASDQTYLDEFRARLAQAAAIVGARSPDAVVLVIIDAADNLGMAAQQAQETNFAKALMQEAPPPGCRIVALARPHRVAPYLQPHPQVRCIDLEPFTVEESAQLLRRRFPEATDDQVAQFHYFTDRNPRVQANALSMAPDLASLCATLGPVVETAESLVAGQLAAAFAKVEREHAADGELDRLGAALAVLPPPVPLRTLAMASTLSEDAIRSFVADFAGGRPILILDGAVQFRDEPTETWFRETFVPTAAEWGQVADRLQRHADTDPYVATVFPIVLHQAERHDQLMELALGNAPPDVADPVERRAIILQRVTYGLRAAVALDRMTDAVKLLVRAAEEVAADSRQVAFLNAHADLVGHLADPGVVADHVFRRRPWRDSDKSFIACAAMLSANRLGRSEAKQYLRLAMQWLADWAADQRTNPNNHRRPSLAAEDVALYAETIARLQGAAAMVDFLDRWSGLMPFVAGRIVAKRLLDLGERDMIEAILADAQASVLARLAVTLEMTKRCFSPPPAAVQRLIDELLAEPAPLEAPDREADVPLYPAIAAVAECAARASLPPADVQRLLARYPVPHARAYTHYDLGRRRDALLRMAAIAAVLGGRDLMVDEVVPDALRETWSTKRNHGREEREFADLYEQLVPWYALRAKAIAGLMAGAIEEAVQAALSASGKNRYYDDPTRYSARQEIVRLHMEALLWTGTPDGISGEELERLVGTESSHLSTKTWTELARLAASRPAGAEVALRCAGHVHELMSDVHQDAREVADAFMGAARALLPLDRGEAAHYVREALDHIGRLGDELYGRLMTLTTLADHAGTDCCSPREAYRLARAAELLHTYNDHKFPWPDVVDSLAHLHIPSAFAAVARWDDRDVVSIERCLPSLASEGMMAGHLSPESVVALHAFGGYWGGKRLAERLFAGLPDKRSRQTALDIIVSDHDLDPMAEGPPIEALQTEARRHGLVSDRLSALAADRQSSEAEEEWRPAKDDSPPPDWERIFYGLDLSTADGVNQAMDRWRNERAGTLDDAYPAMRSRVAPGARANHVVAIASSNLEYGTWALDALEGCHKEWKHVASVRAVLPAAVRRVVDEWAEDFVPYPELERNDLTRCSALGEEPRPQLLRRMLCSISRRVQDISASTLFRFAGTLAQEALSPAEALDALSYSLDRLEHVLKERDGDGPWRTELAPPGNIDDAMAGFLYAMLGSPEAESRWRAAHAVLRLARLGQASALSALVGLLPCRALPAFTGAGLPFYALHARLWLLIALARSVAETPNAVAPHLATLLHWALEADEPHVLIRHFAAQAALALADAGVAEIDGESLARLHTVNVSALAPTAAERSLFSDHHLHGDWRVLPPFDFDKEWIAPLSRAFGVSLDDVFERMEVWICDRWEDAPPRYRDDPRSERARRHGFSRHYLPTFDLHSFYVCWHALFCAAGELLGELAPAIAWGENGWEAWIRRQGLTRRDGRWLADRRDPLPQGLKPEMGEVGYGPGREEWATNVSGDQLDAALGMSNAELVVHGWWRQVKYGNQQRVKINSALVMPETAMALLRALQTAPSPYAFNLGSIGEDEDESDVPGHFRVERFVIERDSELGVDRFDVFAGEVTWPQPEPTPIIRQTFGLVPDQDRRYWRADDRLALKSEAWGARSDERRGDQANSGHRMIASLPFLKEALRRFGRDLILEVEIEREYDGEERRYDPEHVGNRPYNRIYLLRSATGSLHTLHGSVQLWSEVD